MSILIKGMKMPKDSQHCKFTEMNENWERICTIGGRFQWHNTRLCDNCPMVEVPPHGRLIDADDLMHEFAKFVRASNNSDFAPVPTWNDAVSLLGSAPTIIEAEEGEGYE